MARYSDIDLTFYRNTADNDITKLLNEAAVKNAVKNCVLTARGEKLWNTSFGTIIRKLFFGLLDFPLGFRLKKQILYAIQNNEPRVNKVKVDIYIEPELNLLTAHIYFNIIDLGIQSNVAVVLDRVR